MAPVTEKHAPRWMFPWCCVAAFLILAACTAPIRTVEGVDLATPAGASLEQVSREIRKAAHFSGWRVVQLAPGRLEATLRVKVHVLLVEITHTEDTMSIRYKNSVNLRYDGQNIHRNANGWIQRLETSILRHTSTLDPSTKVPETAPVQAFDHPTRELRRRATGSGFIVAEGGYVLTNDHVVEKCSEVRVGSASFAIVSRDSENDLALIKGRVDTSTDVAIFRYGRSVRLGEDVYVAGYPWIATFQTGMNVTKGTVSALATTSILQITAPVQPGNSGGPILDTSGNVVGIVMAKLSAPKMLRATGNLPENVNFGIKGIIAQAFLDSQAIGYKTSRSQKTISAPDIAGLARRFTVVVECWN